MGVAAVPGDPEGMRRLALELEREAEAVDSAITRALRQSQLMIFEGPAAVRIRGQLDALVAAGRSTTGSLLDAGATLRAGAARVEAERAAAAAAARAAAGAANLFDAGKHKP